MFFVGLEDKAESIKDENLWNEVRGLYLEKKNAYLRRNDNNHPSLNVYTETINEIYNKYINTNPRDDSFRHFLFI